MTDDPAVTPPTPPRQPSPGRRESSRQPPRPWLYLPLSRTLLALAGVLLVLLGVVGALTVVQVRSVHNTTSLAAQQQEIAQLKDILGYLTGSKVSKANAEGNVWLVEQLQDICAALHQRPAPLPGCKPRPLPPILQQLIDGKLTPPPTIPPVPPPPSSAPKR